MRLHGRQHVLLRNIAAAGKHHQEHDGHRGQRARVLHALRVLDTHHIEQGYGPEDREGCPGVVQRTVLEFGGPVTGQVEPATTSAADIDNQP